MPNYGSALHFPDGTNQSTAGLVPANNLSEVADKVTSRSNLLFFTSTSFPPSPTLHSRVVRTDLNYTEWYYDGTRWRNLAVESLVFSQRITFPLSPSIATTHDATVPQDYGIWIERWSLTCYIVTTNNGSNYWTFTLFADDGSNNRLQIAQVNTSALSANAWRPLSATSFTSNPYSAGSRTVINIDTGTQGTPGSLYLATSIRYRSIL